MLNIVYISDVYIFMSNWMISQLEKIKSVYVFIYCMYLLGSDTNHGFNKPDTK